MLQHVPPSDAAVAARAAARACGDADVGGGRLFWAAKRLFDIVMSVLLLAILVPVAVILLILNPWLNRGPLLFSQQRMGKGCKPFTAYKFRSMVPAGQILRSHEDPIELDRITPLGGIIRKLRIDELPQIINVLKGEMSLIGPRPDYFEHACRFLSTVPGYAERHAIRPGISGLAQIEVGYAAGTDATCRKVAADLHYIRNAGFALETRLVLGTIWTILTMKGA